MSAAQGSWTGGVETTMTTTTVTTAGTSGQGTRRRSMAAEEAAIATMNSTTRRRQRAVTVHTTSDTWPKVLPLALAPLRSCNITGSQRARRLVELASSSAAPRSALSALRSSPACAIITQGRVQGLYPGSGIVEEADIVRRPEAVPAPLGLAVSSNSAPWPPWALWLAMLSVGTTRTARPPTTDAADHAGAGDRSPGIGVCPEAARQSEKLNIRTTSLPGQDLPAPQLPALLSIREVSRDPADPGAE